jgi:hypothetical protein
MMAMALVALAAGAVDHLYIENVNIGAITAGRTFDVEVSLQNETVYSAMQVDVALTAGLEMVRDDEGYVCWLSPARATNNHVLSVYEQDDGALRVFVTTQNARALKICALMKALPDEITVDITSLGLDKRIKAGDIEMKNVTIVSDKDTIICGVKTTRNVTAAAAED